MIQLFGGGILGVILIAVMWQPFMGPLEIPTPPNKFVHADQTCLQAWNRAPAVAPGEWGSALVLRHRGRCYVATTAQALRLDATGWASVERVEGYDYNANHDASGRLTVPG